MDESPKLEDGAANAGEQITNSNKKKPGWLARIGSMLWAPIGHLISFLDEHAALLLRLPP
jgi:hypothetical protein